MSEEVPPTSPPAPEVKTETTETSHMTRPTPPTAEEDPFKDKTIYDFQVLNCYRELYNLKQHLGKVVLISNVASNSKEYTENCYRILTTLHNKYATEGLDILAFPCNQFGAAEPGPEDEIAESVTAQYPSVGEIEFPIMAKVEVNGEHELPLFSFLKSRIKGTLGQASIKWNFTYFLVDRAGNPVARFAPDSTLEEVEAQVVKMLRNTETEPSSPTLQEDTSPPSRCDTGAGVDSA